MYNKNVYVRLRLPHDHLLVRAYYDTVNYTTDTDNIWFENQLM